MPLMVASYAQKPYDDNGWVAPDLTAPGAYKRDRAFQLRRAGLRRLGKPEHPSLGLCGGRGNQQNTAATCNVSGD